MSPIRAVPFANVPRQWGWAAEKDGQAQGTRIGANCLGRTAYKDLNCFKCQGGWALAALCQTGLTPTPTAEGHSIK